jgi:ABC-2 type transport system permease protein
MALGFFLVILPALGGPHAPTLPTVALMGLLLGVSVGFGGLIGAIAPEPLKAMQLLLAFNTPAFPFSGYTFPEWAMPPILARLTRPLPFSLFVDGYRSFAGWASDRAWIGIWGLVAWVVLSWLLLVVASRKKRSLPENQTATIGANTLSNRSLIAELRLLVRNANLKTLFFAAPLVYLALYGSMYVLKEEQAVPLGVVHGNASTLSRELVRNLDAHPSIAVVPLISINQAKEALRKGEVRAVLELPVNLDLRLRRREATSIPLLFVADRFLPANDLQRGVAEVLLWRGTQERLLTLQARGLAPSQARDRATALALDDRPLANPRETYGDFMLPPLGLLVLHQLCFVAIAYATASAGTTSRKRLLARLLIFVPWFGMWCLAWIAGALPFFDVPVTPQVLPLTLLCLGGLVAVSLLGMCFGLLLRRPLAVLQLGAFTSYPFFFGSGASWPWEAIPDWIAKPMHLVPLTPWLSGAGRTLRMGARLLDIRTELLHLALLTVLWVVVLEILRKVRTAT